MPREITCPACQGTGRVHLGHLGDPPDGTARCQLCEGSGRIPAAFDRHLSRDPHCTCNDCLAYHDAMLRR